MKKVPLLLQPAKKYAQSLNMKYHSIIALMSLLVFVSMIIFAFIPLTNTIAESGYSTMHLQEAQTREEVDTILSAFNPVMASVRLLTLADYIFILAGFFLFFSIHSLCYNILTNNEHLMYLPLIGMLLTIISRTLDSLENLWILLIYSFPETYPTILIPMTNYTETAKWFVVNIEYSTLLVTIIVTLVYYFRNRSIETNKSAH